MAVLATTDPSSRCRLSTFIRSHTLGGAEGSAFPIEVLVPTESFTSAYISGF